MGFFSWAKKINNFATGSTTINAAGDMFGVSDSSIFRTGGNPVIEYQNKEDNRADNKREQEIKDARQRRIDEFNAAHPGGSVDPATAADDARGVMGNITRNQWSDFQANALPVKDQLEGMTTYNGNTGVVDALKADARQNAKSAYNSAMADINNNAAGYGMSLSNKGSLERAAKLGMAASTVDGVNRAIDYQADLNKEIMSGSSVTSGGRNYTS